MHNSPMSDGAGRRGFALFLALTLVSVLVLALFIATEGALSTSGQVDRLKGGNDAAFAVEAVLLRREHDVMRLAVVGDPRSLAEWKSNNVADALGRQNYGVDTINGYDVLWKIEPTRTAPQGFDAASRTLVQIPNISNPAPDPELFMDPRFSMGREARKEIPNSSVFLYRIVAEARDHTPVGTVEDGARRAQGVRIVNIANTPLFENVLFYAQKGPKGDLELSHADAVRLEGSIYSNGAIYLGGGLTVNDQLAQRGSINGFLKPTASIIGPVIDAAGNDVPVQVTGFDGVFRLNKPLMFSIVNEFPLSNTAVYTVGPPQGDWTLDGSFNTGSGKFPKDEPAGSAAVLTQNGTVINPYRITDRSGAVTQGIRDNVLPNLSDQTGASLIDNSARAINRQMMYSTNDARDESRSQATAKWVQVAKDVFKNQVRTRENGGISKPVTEAILNRGFEPQTLHYRDLDGRGDTDEHEFAQPEFLGGSGEVTTNVASRGTGIGSRVVENPGTFVTHALGDNNAVMVRYPNGTGWLSRDKTNTSLPPVEGQKMGLMIRERPVPLTAYWPGTLNVPVVDRYNSRYLPYAYGKHWYPTISPFTPMDVSDNLMRTWRFNNGAPSVTTNLSQVDENRLVSYGGGGRLSVTAAVNPGPGSGVDGAWSVGGYRYPGSNVTRSIVRRQYYYRDAWRFAHLGKYRPNLSLTGLKLVLYRDSDSAVPTEDTYQDEFRSTRTPDVANPPPAQSPLPFAVGNDFRTAAGVRSAAAIIPVTNPLNGIVPMTGGVPGWAAAPLPPAAGYWSARWVGFWRPPATGTYAFAVTRAAGDVSSMARLWIDGQWVGEAGTTWLAGNVNYAPAAPAGATLIRDVDYPIVIEYASGAPGATGFAAPTITYAGPATGSIGGASVHPPHTVTTAPNVAAPTIPIADFQAIQCRIEDPHSLASPTNLKVGLMIRPEQAIAPLQQGGGAYAMVGWSQNRGFFTQRRVMPARQSQRTTGTYYIGAGLDNDGARTLTGTILDDSRVMPRVQREAILTATPSVRLADVQQRNDNPNPRVVYTDVPAPYAGPMALAVGGTNVTIQTPFSIGAYVGRRIFTPQSRLRRTLRIRQTVGLTRQISPFLATDVGAQLTLFANPTGTATADGGANIVDGSAAGNQSLGWWFSTGTGVYSAAAPITNLSRIYESTPTTGPWMNGMDFEVPGENPQTFGGPNTIWSNSPIQISVGGQVQTATLQQLQDFVGNPLLTYSPAGGLTWPALTPAQVALLTPAYPLLGTIPVPPAPTLPTVPAIGGIGGLTFSLARTQSDVWFDLNPWVSTRTPLLASNQVPSVQYLPRPTQAGYWPATWNWVPTTWPASVGQRPDLWSTGGAQGRTSVPTMGALAASTSSLSGITGIGVDGNVAGWNGYSMLDDVQPPGFAAAANTEVWLRIEKTGNIITFRGFVGVTPPTGPADSRWVNISMMDDTEWAGSELLLGPCVQNGTTASKTTVNFSNLRIETALPAPNKIIDQEDWDVSVPGATDDISLYLMSQYQVWFGSTDISEHFLSWVSTSAATAGRRLVSEDWFFQTREFWSQSRWWDHLSAAGRAVEKDLFPAGSNSLQSTEVRRLLGKTTVLNLDLEMIQYYLRNMKLSDISADKIPLIEAPPVPYSSPDATMMSCFNGLIYAVRTNRYPWNPDREGPNPATPHPSIPMPNDSAPLLNYRIQNGASAATWVDPANANTFGHRNPAGTVVHKLEPYGLPVAPAFRPQNFHHGVRIINGRNINVGYPDLMLATKSALPNEAGGYDWTYRSVPKFESSGLSVVTPNQLYLQGSLNVDRFFVQPAGDPAPSFKYTPLAVMGDQVTMLSNSWDDAKYQVDGLTVTNTLNAPTGGTLAREGGAKASNTWYHAGVVTNNSPTTRERVLEGQGGPFTDTTRFLENWTNVTMHYLGSFIVLDSRRYSQAFLLDVPKNYGSTPFGIIANANTSPEWLKFWTEDPMGFPVPTAVKGSVAYRPASASGWIWKGRVPQIYSEAIRKYTFNQDFRMPDGTAPFVPAGVTSAGVGSWIRTFP